MLVQEEVASLGKEGVDGLVIINDLGMFLCTVHPEQSIDVPFVPSELAKSLRPNVQERISVCVKSNTPVLRRAYVSSTRAMASNADRDCSKLCLNFFSNSKALVFAENIFEISDASSNDVLPAALWKGWLSSFIEQSL